MTGPQHTSMTGPPHDRRAPQTHISLRARRAGPISWIILAIVTCLVVTWCIGWGRYAATWSYPRWVATEPGEFVELEEGGSLRVVAIERVDSVSDTFDNVQRPPEGGVFVRVTFDYRPDPAGRGTCSMNLAVADRNLSDLQAEPMDGGYGCGLFEPGVTTTGEISWAVPAAWADQVAGVSVATGRYGTTLLLRPES